MEIGRLTYDTKTFSVLNALKPLAGAIEDPRVPTITVQELMNHRSCWADDIGGNRYGDVYSAAKALGLPLPGTFEGLIRYELGRPLDYEPGTQYHYCNFCYGVLAEVVQTASGAQYEYFVREVLRSVGLASTRIGRHLKQDRFPVEATYYVAPGTPLVAPIYAGLPPLVPVQYGGITVDWGTGSAAGAWISNTIELLRLVASVTLGKTPAMFRLPPRMGWSFSGLLAASAEFSPPAITLVANTEGESPVIAPNTWVEVKGLNLAPAGDTRVWQAADFTNNQMPTQLDGVSVMVGGRKAYVYYISPAQINILTSADAMQAPVQVVVTNNGASSGGFAAQAQALSLSFFVFNGGPYVAALHPNGTYIGPTALYPGLTTPAAPGETIVLYANGFGPTSMPVTPGSVMQGGTLSPAPVIQIGGITAMLRFAGLVVPGEFQFNVVVPVNAGAGDQPITATYNGQTTQSGTLVTIQH